MPAATRRPARDAPVPAIDPGRVAVWSIDGDIPQPHCGFGIPAKLPALVQFLPEQAGNNRLQVHHPLVRFVVDDHRFAAINIATGHTQPASRQRLPLATGVVAASSGYALDNGAIAQHLGAVGRTSHAQFAPIQQDIMRGRPGSKGQRRPRAQQCAAYGIADQIKALQHTTHCKARGQGDNHAQRRPPGHADGDRTKNGSHWVKRRRAIRSTVMRAW